MRDSGEIDQPRQRHRAALTVPRIPVQKLPTHDTTPGGPEPQPDTQTHPAIPETGRWRASQVPRALAAAVLLMAILGTAILGAQYAQSRTSGDLVSVMIGFAVVVVLCALVIASTPQVVSLEGSVLTVHTTRGTEPFDLADGLQPVDVVGDPRTSHWAVLLHRPNGITLVLRRNDVTARELDPIVRHYRMLAAQRRAERDSRFDR